MFETTIGEQPRRRESSRLDSLLEQVLKATPLYLFASGLRSAFRSTVR